VVAVDAIVRADHPAARQRTGTALTTASSVSSSLRALAGEPRQRRRAPRARCACATVAARFPELAAQLRTTDDALFIVCIEHADAEPLLVRRAPIIVPRSPAARPRSTG
jgi:hypothetical protein